MTTGCRLKQCGQDAWSNRQDIYGRVVQIEHDYEQCVDEVEDEEDSKEDLRNSARKQKRVAASRVVEKKA